jgi:ubiquinone/menaquinone biosynthesis C-methylase UbiE
MADTIEYYNTIAPLLSNDEDHYYNGALLVDLDSDPTTFIDQDVENIIELAQMGRRVLECGCGGGYFFKRLKEKKQTISYYGIDISEEQIECAKKNNPKHKDRFQVASWDNIPFEDEYFDCIIFLETIGYAENVDRMISECYRVLKPGGRLFSKHPGSTLPGVMSELDSKVNYEKIFELSRESLMKADVEKYTQYMKDASAESNYDLRTGKLINVPSYWNEFNPFKSLIKVSQDYGYSENSLGMLMNVPAFIEKLEQNNFSVPDGYTIPPTDSSLHLKTFLIEEVHNLFVSHKGNNSNISLRFKSGTVQNFWEEAIQQLGNPGLQLYDILTPLGREHLNLMNFMFYNVFPMKEDLNEEYQKASSSRQDAASPCIIFKAIKN